MPPIYIGSQKLLKRYIGSTEVTKVFIGIQEVYSAGMRLGMNLGWINSWAGAIPFSNVLYNMGLWARVTGSGAYTQTKGLLTATVSTDTFRAKISDTGVGMPTGTYTVLNPDGLKIAIGDYSTATFYSGWTTATSFTFSYSATGMLALWAEGSVTNSIGNLSIIIPGHLTSWNSGNVWNTDFINFHKNAKFNVLRMMDWGLASSNIETTWSDRSSATGISLYSPAAGGASVPYELMIDAANRIGADPWVCVPHRADAGHISSMAALFAASLNSDRKLWLELGNEVWNTSDPWGDGTLWLQYLDYTKITATANFGANTFTLSGHGISHGEQVRSFTTIENRSAYVTVDWRLKAGALTYVDVIDANTFRLRETSVTGAIVPVASGQVNVLFVRVAEAGKVGTVAAQNTNYSNVSVRNWDAFDSAMGASRVVRLLSGQAANPSVIQARLGVAAASDRVSYVAIAPYFGGAWLGFAGDIASGQVTPKVWLNSSATIAVGLYAAGSTPTAEEVVAGTGSIATQSVAHTVNATNPVHTAGTAFSGLTNGTTYKLLFVYTDGVGAKWMVGGDVVVSDTTSTSYFNDSYSNQAKRNKLASATDGYGFMDATVAVASGVPIIAYEGGLHFHHSAPANHAAWLDGYQESSEFAGAIVHDLNCMAASGCAEFTYYADVIGTTFSISDSYADTTDARYSALNLLAGEVRKRSRVSVANAMAADILSEPSYPFSVFSMPDSLLTYEIIAGNNKSNYAVLGNEIRLVNGTGINWAAPTPVNLTLTATDGFTTDIFTVAFSTGDAWYESDSKFVFDAVSDTNNAAMDASIGGSLALTGAGATVSGGLFDLGNAGRYSSATASLTTLSAGTPLLIAAVLDKDNQATNFINIMQVGDASSCIRFYYDGPAVFQARLFNTTTTLAKFCPSTIPSGKHVFWVFYDAASTNPALHAGYDQVTNESAFANRKSVTLSRSVFVGGTSTFDSSMKHGSIQIVNRTGMTLEQAKAIVAKMQTLHGIP